jgi:DNA-binding Lrp family transcriptional regulator
MTGILLGQTAKGANVELDLQELTTGRTLLCSVSGGGKSWTSRRIVEQVFGQTGIIIVDVEGEFATLRERYPFLIVGKDVQLVPEAAEFLADQILDHELSAILDGSDPNLDIAAFQEFLERFINRFIAVETAKRKPYLWILEESDELAPESGISRSLCLNAIRKLVKKGRKRGLGVIVLTQRPAFVSKFVISQCRNKLIGGIEWPDDITVLHKFARIPDTVAKSLGELKKGEFYAAGDFVKKDGFVKVGPVLTEHSGGTPELIPPAPRELEAMVAELTEKLPGIIQEKLVPAVPKVAEIEARLKEKVEAQWQARVARKDKELTSIKSRLEAKYETEIADLKRKLDEAVRHATLTGGVSDLLSHPLVQKNLAKLAEKQRAFIELLETRGPQDPERCSLFLEISPKSVPSFVYEINRKIPKLIENIQGRYTSRLAKLFPVTEEAQTEKKEIEILQGQITHLQAEYNHMELRASELLGENERLSAKLKSLESGKFLRMTQQDEGPRLTSAGETPATPLPIEGGTTAVIVRRTVTDVRAITDHHVLDLDKTTWEGKVSILAVENPAFLDEKDPLKASDIGKEIERRFDVTAASGGNLKVLSERLGYLASEGILDRKFDLHERGWVYWRRREFNERIRVT